MSCGQGGDLDQVVGEDPLSGPGFRSFEAVQAGAVPAVSAFGGADPAFASGSPFDGSAGCSAVLYVLAGGPGPALLRCGRTSGTAPRHTPWRGGSPAATAPGSRPVCV